MTTRRSVGRASAWILPSTLALAAIVGAMMLLAALAATALASARALSDGESNWSRLQKDLVIWLLDHARTGDPESLEAARGTVVFRDAQEALLRVVLSGDAPREEIEVAARALPRFGGQASALARAFTWFRRVEAVPIFVERWAEAQARFGALVDLVEPVAAAVADEDQATLDALLREVRQLDEEIEEIRGTVLVASAALVSITLRRSLLFMGGLAILLVGLGGWGIGTVLRRLDHSERTLAESRERFRQVTEGIREVFWLTGADRTPVLYVSPVYARVWGRDPDELRTRPLDWLDAVVEEDLDRIRAAIARQGDEEVEVEYRIRTPEGALRWIRERSFPVRAREKPRRRVAGISEDITERRVLEQELLEAQKLRSVARLSAGIAHEYNNLLTAVRAHVQFLRMDLTDREDTREDLEGIDQSVARAEALTRKLLAFGRQQVVLPEPTRLPMLLGELEPLLRSILPAGIRLEVETDSDLPLARADRVHLREALLALVTNSRDALDRGGTIRIVARPLGSEDRQDTFARTPEDRTGQLGGIPVEGRILPGKGFVVVEVVDAGSGIPDEIRTQLFEPFNRGRSGAASLGLGLPAVLGLMEQMDGGLRVDSTPGEGTRIRLYLPVEASPAVSSDAT